MGHAFFSPSASSRWLSCTASMTIDVSHLERKSGYAAELGTALHEAGEQLLLGQTTRSKLPGNMFNGIKIEKEHVTNILVPYAEFVKKHCNGVRHELHTEMQSVLIPDECWGTADAVIVQWNEDGTVTLKIIDLKTGAGTKVSPIDNSQLMIYAAGIYEDFSMLYDIASVEIGICQPPFDVYAMRKITPDELDEFKLSTLQAIKFIQDGVVEFVPTESNCQWCPAASICPELNKVANEAAVKDFSKIEKTSNKSLAQQMEMIPLVMKWASAVQEEANARLLKGKKVKGLKLVRGRSSRQWKFKQETLEKKLQQLKIPKAWWYNQKFISPAQFETLLVEKNKDHDIYEKLVRVEPGGAVVALESDNREEFDPNEGARKDFEKVSKPKAKRKRNKK